MNDGTERTNAELDADIADMDDAAEFVTKALEKKREPKQADILVTLAEEADLFHTSAGGAFADIHIHGHRETWPVRAKGFKRWLVRRFYETQKGAPNSEALQSALNIIDSKAHFDGPELEVNLRIAGLDGKIYIDLANDAWRAVEVDPNGGWQVIDDPPVRFRRAAGMLPLPEPEAGGSIDALRPFLNVSSDDDFVLAVAWVLAALRNRGPYPVLVLAGEQGSAKSTFASIMRALIDPNTAPLRALPREDRDLFIAANNGHVLCFDNVSGLPTWISDTLCRLATGGGFAVRQLYSDSDEMLFDATRPVILNGIEDIVARPDLADRAIFLTLTPIPEEQRRPESELRAEFKEELLAILGALLDAMVGGLARLPDIRLARHPRMADFAKWATACEPSFADVDAFMTAYDGNRADAVVTVIEADPVATAVRDLMATRTLWTGTASELLGALSVVAGEHIAKAKTWPADGTRLSGRLRRAATFLRKIGIDISWPRPRTIEIKNTPPVHAGNTASIASTASGNGSQLPQASATNAKNAKKPNQSGGPRCRQCDGDPDGTEQEFPDVNDELAWLHPECRPFWMEGDAWGRRR